LDKHGVITVDQGIANYFQGTKVAARDECFMRCVKLDFCAGASFKNASTDCYLFKFGLKAFNSTQFVSFIKHEFLAEEHRTLAELESLFPGDHIYSDVQFAAPFLHFDSLSPAACFRNCSLTANCTGASFQAESLLAFNCYFYKTTSAAHLPGFISYVNHERIEQLEVTHHADKLESKRIGLNGSMFIQSVVNSSSSCFHTCDLVPHCAGAMFNGSAEINCALFHYAFTETAEDSILISYIKPVVSADRKNEIDLKHEADSVNFPHDLIIREVEFDAPFLSLASVSPSECFRVCSQNAMCLAATFFVEAWLPLNCELFRASVLTLTPKTNRTVSFVRNFNVKEEAKPVAREKSEIMEHTKLSFSFQTLILNSKEACFEHCDLLPFCAAASYESSLRCSLHSYGFELSSKVDGSVAYVRPEVSEEMARAREVYFLDGEVKQSKQVVHNMGCLYLLAPSMCFEKCSMLRECGAATFLTRMTSVRVPNCCFTTRGSIMTEVEEAKTVLFVKNEKH
jgi:hypothetical protein